MLLNETDELEIIKKRLVESIETKQRILNDEKVLLELLHLADEVAEVIRSGGKILICGNGGSASDAIHIAGELVGRFQRERKAYAVIALNDNVATITAVANDYGYKQVFSRQVEALMTPQDILIGLSTSGNSENIIEAFNKAHEIGGRTALFSGRDGGKLREIADFALIVHSENTARIQECHMSIYHILCELVELRLCK